MNKFLRKSEIVEALLWGGGDTKWLDIWIGNNWTRADARDVVWEHEDEECLIVWNSVFKLWLSVPVGHWIIRGAQGEFYPCKEDIFGLNYEEIE